MRLYTFINVYLSSIQQGIQSAHVVGELSLQSGPMFEDWAVLHKTIIVCNGGNNDDLYNLYAFFNQNSTYPWASFSEDMASLNGTLTAIGIILPEFIWSEIDRVRKSISYVPNDMLSQRDKLLVAKIAEYSLAR